MTTTRILVHLDTWEGMEEKITLHWRNYSWKKNLYYEGVPFTCRRCHNVGHLYKYFSLISPSSPPASNGKKHLQSEDPIVDEQPLGPDSLMAVVGDTVWPTFSFRILPISLPMTRSRSTAATTPSLGKVYSPFSSAMNISNFIFTMASTSSYPLVSNPITCAIDPL